MAEFIVRIELHGLNSYDHPDYAVLHKSMEDEGFLRFIKVMGISHHLPRAEYFYSGEIAKVLVLKKAKDAAATTGRKASIVVTEANGEIIASGLKPNIRGRLVLPLKRK